MKARHLVSIACVAVGLSAASRAHAEPPPLLPVQGYLTDAAANPLDGDVQVRFRLYAVETGGTALHDETQTVAAQDGHFTVYLGTETTLDLMLFADNGDVYLGLTVEDDAEAEPRIRFATVPFAAVARYCGDAETLGGMGATDFAASTHTHVPVNAATLCADGQYLDGDGNCYSVPVDTDTTYTANGMFGVIIDASNDIRLWSGCTNGQVLKAGSAGTWSCGTDSNAGTLCAAGQYLDGDGNCYSLPVDTNAETLCLDGFFLNGDGSCDALAPASGSSNYVQNQTASAQSASMRISGTVRMGSETGTSEGPDYPGTGLIVRRIRSTVSTDGSVVAVAGSVTVERDGTDGGFKVRNSFMTNPNVKCFLMDFAGSLSGKTVTIGGIATVALFADADNIIMMQCQVQYSHPSPMLDEAMVLELSRTGFGDTIWSGFVTSTTNQ